MVIMRGWGQEVGKEGRKPDPHGTSLVDGMHEQHKRCRQQLPLQARCPGSSTS